MPSLSAIVPLVSPRAMAKKYLGFPLGQFFLFFLFGQQIGNFRGQSPIAFANQFKFVGKISGNLMFSEKFHPHHYPRLGPTACAMSGP